MSGKEDHNEVLFNEVESRLKECGREVVNPAKLHEKNGVEPWHHYLRIDLAAMMQCNSIFLLPDWIESKGVRKELWASFDLDFQYWELREGGEVYEMQQASLKKILERATAEQPPDETILEEAQRLVHGDRNDSYGPPTEDFRRAGRIWGAILGTDDIPPETIGLMMVGLKISREVHKPKRDNRVDMAGYAETVDMIHNDLAS